MRRRVSPELVTKGRPNGNAAGPVVRKFASVDRASFVCDSHFLFNFFGSGGLLRFSHDRDSRLRNGSLGKTAVVTTCTCMRRDGVLRHLVFYGIQRLDQCPDGLGLFCDGRLFELAESIRCNNTSPSPPLHVRRGFFCVFQDRHSIDFSPWASRPVLRIAARPSRLRRRCQEDVVRQSRALVLSHREPWSVE